MLCAGTECGMTCEPFDPYSDWGIPPGPREDVEVYELVGILRVEADKKDGPAPVLERLDLEASSQEVGTEPRPIPTGVFRHAFP